MLFTALFKRKFLSVLRNSSPGICSSSVYSLACEKEQKFVKSKHLAAVIWRLQTMCPQWISTWEPDLLVLSLWCCQYFSHWRDLNRMLCKPEMYCRIRSIKTTWTVVVSGVLHSYFCLKSVRLYVFSREGCFNVHVHNVCVIRRANVRQDIMGIDSLFQKGE